jgi:hypothetical protein
MRACTPHVIPRDRHAMYFATPGRDHLLDGALGDRDPPSPAIYPANMRKEPRPLGGPVHPQSVLIALPRSSRHARTLAVVQRNAMKVWRGPGGRFPCGAFDLAHHMKHVDLVFERVFGTVRG